MDYAGNMHKCNEYVEALEEERRKIQVFQRELPLCFELVTQAIDACRQQLSGATTTTEYLNGQSDCSEQATTSGGPGPVLEEFIPLKRNSSSDEDEQQSNECKNSRDMDVEKSGKKLDWLRSVQLWNQTPDLPLKEDPPRKASVMEVKKNGGAFRPFNKDKSAAGITNPPSTTKSPRSVPATATSSTAETVTGRSCGSRREEKERLSDRKQRRSWSPELHRRFIHALQQLGGSHVATPKQIRDLMKVDGLTNDEVKSHLQKYRLHTRRPSHNSNSQAPQYVVVGGIWVQPEYGAVTPTTTTTTSGEASGAAAANINGIHQPVAAPPQASVYVTQKQQQTQYKHPHSDEERGSHCNSPAVSSSTHTTTTPVF